MVVVSYLVKIVMPFKPLLPDLTRRETAKYKVGLDFVPSRLDPWCPWPYTDTASVTLHICAVVAWALTKEAVEDFEGD